MLRTLLLTFIPLFVAVDVVALILIYLGIGLCRPRAEMDAGLGEG